MQGLHMGNTSMQNRVRYAIGIVVSIYVETPEDIKLKITFLQLV